MVTKTINENKALFECDECHLKFKDQSRAEECEAHFKEHNACKIDIINYAEK